MSEKESITLDFKGYQVQVLKLQWDALFLYCVCKLPTLCVFDSFQKVALLRFLCARFPLKAAPAVGCNLIHLLWKKEGTQVYIFPQRGGWEEAKVNFANLDQLCL